MWVGYQAFRDSSLLLSACSPPLRHTFFLNYGDRKRSVNLALLSLILLTHPHLLPPPPSWLTQIGQCAPQKLYCNLAALKNSLIKMHSFLVQDTRYATVTVYALCLNLQRVRRYKACPFCGELVVRLDTHLKARKHQHLTQAERSYYLVSMKLMHHTSEPCNQARSRKRLV